MNLGLFENGGERKRWGGGARGQKMKVPERRDGLNIELLSEQTRRDHIRTKLLTIVPYVMRPTRA